MYDELYFRHLLIQSLFCNIFIGQGFILRKFETKPFRLFLNEIISQYFLHKMMISKYTNDKQKELKVIS